MEEYWKSNDQMKKVQKILSEINYKGVNLWKVALPRLYYIEGKRQGKKVDYKIDFLKLISYFFFRREINLSKKDEKKIWATFFVGRKDHEELFDKSLSKFNKKEISKFKKRKYKFKINSFKIFFEMFNYLKKRNFSKLGYGSSFKFSALLFYYTKQIDFFQKKITELNPVAYISFNSSENPDENIITQILNRKKKETFIFQHSPFYNYSVYDEFRGYYDAAVSNNFLVWGKKSFKILKEMSFNKNIIIVGNPKQIKAKSNKRQFKKLKKGLLILNSNSFLESNMSMLKMVKKLPAINISLDIKMHPLNKLNDYNLFSSQFKFLNKNSNTNKLIKKYDFIILQNTALSLEVLSREIPRFRFKDKYTLDLSGPPDFFENKKDLLSLIKKYSNKKDFKKLMSSYEKEYFQNFHSSPKMSVPEYYKEKIKEKIKKSISKKV